MRRHPAGNALPDLQPHVLQPLRARADRDLEVKLMGFLVEHQQRPRIRLQQVADLLPDGLEDLLLIDIGKQRLTDFMKKGEAFDLMLQLGNFHARIHVASGCPYQRQSVQFF